MSHAFQQYAFLAWPLHYQELDGKLVPEGLRRQLRSFLFQGCETGLLYTNWVLVVAETPLTGYAIVYESLARSLHRHLQALPSTPLTPLFLACSFGIGSLVKDLELCPNVDWNQKNHRGTSALFLAASDGRWAVVRLLRKNGANFICDNGADYYSVTNGGTALHVTSHAGQNDIIQDLLQHGAKLEAKDGVGCTSLVCAADYGHRHTVQLLLNKGADINAHGKLGSALSVASGKGYIDIVQLLLNNGSSLEIANSEGQTALIKSAGNGNSNARIVRLLLEAGADARATDSGGRTAFHRLCKFSSGSAAIIEETAALLLAYGADANATDKHGNTPLHSAMKNNLDLLSPRFSRKVEAMLKTGRMGPSLEIRNSLGQTPLEMAISISEQDPHVFFSPDEHSILLALQGEEWRDYFNSMWQEIIGLITDNMKPQLAEQAAVLRPKQGGVPTP